MRDKLIRLIASGLGLGYLPLAPGTFGTLWGSFLFYGLRGQSQIWFIQFTIVFSVLAILIAHRAEKSFKQKDCRKIVIDEVAGALCCYAFVPFTVFNLVIGFILFRLFDVAKVFPARQAQCRLKGGLGVVVDDLVAGIQAGLILYFLPVLMKGTGVGLEFLNFKL